VEKGHDRGVVSVFGPVRATRMAYRNRREANLYPAGARWMLPEDPYSLAMRALVAYHLAEGGYGPAGDVIQSRTGQKIGPAQLAGMAADLRPGVPYDRIYLDKGLPHQPRPGSALPADSCHVQR
jgi:hypothetical protein